jgi:hypothetical protein
MPVQYKQAFVMLLLAVMYCCLQSEESRTGPCLTKLRQAGGVGC